MITRDNRYGVTFKCDFLGEQRTFEVVPTPSYYHASRFTLFPTFRIELSDGAEIDESTSIGSAYQFHKLSDEQLDSACLRIVKCFLSDLSHNHESKSEKNEVSTLNEKVRELEAKLNAIENALLDRKSSTPSDDIEIPSFAMADLINLGIKKMNDDESIAEADFTLSWKGYKTTMCWAPASAQNLPSTLSEYWDWECDY